LIVIGFRVEARALMYVVGDGDEIVAQLSIGGAAFSVTAAT
jgi:hypothetical protein